MAYVINTGDIILVTMKGSLAGQLVLNTFTYKAVLPSPVTDGNFELGLLLEEFCTDIALPFQAMYPMQSNEFAWQETWAQKIWPTRFVRRVRASAQVGGQATPSYPPNVSACVSRRSDLAGRGRVGRIEIAGLPQDSAPNGLWNASATTSLTTFGTAVLQSIDVGLEPNVYKPVVFRRATPGTSPDVITCTVQPTSRVMRRRTVGVGR